MDLPNGGRLPAYHSPPLLRLIAAFTGAILGTLGRGVLAAGDAVLRRL